MLRRFMMLLPWWVGGSTVFRTAPECTVRHLCALCRVRGPWPTRRLLGSPIDRVRSHAGGRGRDELEIIRSQADRGLLLSPLGVGDEGGLQSPHQGLVCLVDRPG